MFECFKKKPVIRQIQHEPTKLQRVYPVSYLDTALKITGDFEGTGFGQVSGNFDNQGISAGVLQWCYGQGSLQQKILLPIIESYGEMFIDAFFPMSISHTAYMTPKKAIKFAKKNMLNGTRLKPSWQEAWNRFMLSAEVVAQQKIAAGSVASKAQYYCDKNNMNSLREFCWFFDIVTQNGSLKGIGYDENFDAVYGDDIKNDGGINRNLWSTLPNVDRIARILFVWTCDRVTRNKWAPDVIARKGTIAHMQGVVHGHKYDFRSQIS